MDPFLFDDDARPAPPADAGSKTQQADAAKALDRARELETRNQKLRQELDGHAKAASAADQARKTQEARVKEVETLIEGVTKDLEAKKKQVADARARIEAAERDADKAKSDARGPQDDRVKTMDLLLKKNQADLAAQKKQASDAQAREASARLETEKVRQQGQRTIEQIRQQSQQTIEQLRQENQRTVERLRQELAQARAEALRQKQAAEEARRKIKQ